MKAAVLLLCTTLGLLSSCKHDPDNPYRNYKVTNDEAIPASKVGGAPYRFRR